jgi:uridine kinase
MRMRVRPGGGNVRAVLSFDEVIASVGAQPGLRLMGIDGLPMAGKSTLASQLAVATGGACVHLDEFVKPEAEWRWHDRPSFPFDYIRYDQFLDAVTTLAENGWCQYRPYNWATGKAADAARVVRVDGPVIVEGVSALHPDLDPLYGLRIWVESDATTVLAASQARGVGAWMREWEEMFLPSAGLYLQTDPRARADVLAAGRGFVCTSYCRGRCVGSAMERRCVPERGGQ